ncbi:MAG TPA: CARDB domain-containing protein [Candidatus Saccharimonadales bacterium]|nr:CARDB domain-containing protein [Candidatus Saccharimonadales bacterium]
MIGTLSVRKLLILSFACLVFGLLFIFLPKKAFAAPNSQGLGWALPVVKTNVDGAGQPVNTCFGPNPGFSLITVVLRDGVTGGIVNGAITMKNVNSTFGNTASAVGSSATIGCIVPGSGPNTGVWVSVWGVPGYESWQYQMPSPAGPTANFNWCCGFGIDYASGVGGNGGYSLVYNIYLIPNGQNGSLQANNPQPTGRVIVSNTATNVNVDFQSLRGLQQAGTSNSVLDGFIWLSGPANPACGGGTSCFISLCYTLCGNFLGIGGTLSRTLNNLPLGKYTYYVQLHETSRAPCTTWIDGRTYCMNNDIPITAQTDFQTFCITNTAGNNVPCLTGRNQPNLTGSVNNPGTITPGTSVTFNGTSQNIGNAPTGGPFFVRFCLDAPDEASCYSDPAITGKTYTGTTVLESALNSGASSLSPKQWTWTATSGDHQIVFCVDINAPAGAISETTETADDNCTTQSFTVGGGGGGSKPDLTIVPFSANTPTQAVNVGFGTTTLTSPTGSTITVPQGQAVTFAYRARNIGSVSAGAFITFGSATGSPVTRSIPTATLPANTSTGPQFFGVTWAAVGTYTVTIKTDNGSSVDEADENNNTVVLTIKVSAAPNLQVISVSPLGPVAVGLPVDFRAVVQNTGNSNSAATLGRFCVDNINCYTDNTGQIGNEPGIKALVTNEGTSVDTTSPWIPTGGPHTIYFCADTPKPGAVPETNEDDNCNSYFIPAVSTNNSWLKTTSGDVGSIGQGTNSMRLPAPLGQINIDYLGIGSHGINAKFPGDIAAGARKWLVSDYSGFGLPSPNNYGLLLEKFGKLATGLTANGTLPTTSGVYSYPSGFTWNGIGGTCSLAGATPAITDGMIIFINGDLTIGNGGQNTLNSNANCPVVIVAKGNITVNDAVTTINSFMVSDGIFDSLQNSTNPANPLTINGGVISSLDSTKGRPNFDRQLSNNASPAETLNFKSGYLYMLLGHLGIQRTTFAEVNP